LVSIAPPVKSSYGQANPGNAVIAALHPGTEMATRLQLDDATKLWDEKRLTEQGLLTAEPQRGFRVRELSRCRAQLRQHGAADAQGISTQSHSNRLAGL